MDNLPPMPDRNPYAGVLSKFMDRDGQSVDPEKLKMLMEHFNNGTTPPQNIRQPSPSFEQRYRAQDPQMSIFQALINAWQGGR